MRWATRVASAAGEAFGVLLIVLGVMRVPSGFFIGGMWFFLIGLFIRNNAKMSYQQLVVRRELEGEPLERFMNRDPITVSPETSLEHLAEDYIYRYHHKPFPIVEGDRLIGCITTRQLKEVPRDQWKRKTVGELATACSDENTIEPGIDAVKALDSMHRNRAGRLMVVEDNCLIGIMALKDLLDFLSLKIELDES